MSNQTEAEALLKEQMMHDPLFIERCEQWNKNIDEEAEYDKKLQAVEDEYSQKHAAVLAKIRELQDEQQLIEDAWEQANVKVEEPYTKVRELTIALKKKYGANPAFYNILAMVFVEGKKVE